MKKQLVFVLIFSLLLSLAACGNTPRRQLPQPKPLFLPMTAAVM